MATCGEALVEILQNYGIDTIFGIPGVHTVELYRGLDRVDIRHITPRHEQGAGFMADGYARATGRVAACFIITGPGMTNIVTAMGQALADSIPMLVISSVNRRHELGMGEGRLHELPQQSNLVAGVARFSHTLMRAEELPKVLARAFTVFHSERPGPVHIEIPIDVISENADSLHRKAYNLPSPPAAAEQALKTAAEILNHSSSPLIVVGGGAVNAAAEVRELAEVLDAPVINTVNAKGVLAASHALAVGGSPSSAALREVIQQADAVIAIGTEFGETDYDYFARGDLVLQGKLVRIDIDAQQLTRVVRSDVPICSDARLAIQALLPLLQQRNADAAQQVMALRESHRAARNDDYVQFFETIRSALPDVVIAGDSTQPTYHAYLHYDTEKPRRYFHSASGYGTLGYAIPGAIGAKLGNPYLPVIGLIGDGAAQFSIGELASAVEANINVIFLVWNNSGYQEIKQFMATHDIPTIGVDIFTPDFVGLAESMGCFAERAESLQDLKTALQQAQQRNGPSLIELRQADIAAGDPV